MGKNNQCDDWLYFSQSYLQMAKLACQEIIEPKHNKRDGVKSFWSYYPKDLIIPILYNVKHGIEIFVKTISLIIDEEYDEGHNIKELFGKLKRKFKKVKLQPCKKGGNVITSETIDDFPKKLKEIEKLVNEFYFVEILREKLDKNFVIHDKQNDIFRYPDNKASVKINWEVVLPKFNEKDIQSLKNKIDKLYELFNETGYIITILQKK